MRPSDFQFSDPRIEKIDFRIGKNEKKSKNERNLPIGIEVQTKVNNKQSNAIVSLFLTVGEVDSENEVITPFYFRGTISADFRWQGEFDNKSIENMLRVNGGTVLLSYIRPVLATITMQAGIKPLNLPFINFLE